MDIFFFASHRYIYFTLLILVFHDETAGFYFSTPPLKYQNTFCQNICRLLVSLTSLYNFLHRLPLLPPLKQ